LPHSLVLQRAFLSGDMFPDNHQGFLQMLKLMTAARESTSRIKAVQGEFEQKRCGKPMFTPLVSKTPLLLAHHVSTGLQEDFHLPSGSPDGRAENENRGKKQHNE